MARIGLHLFAFFALVVASPFVHADDGLNAWLAAEEKIAVRRLLDNVSPSDAAPGAIIASPERHNPPYYYHWVRDSALTVSTLIELYDRAQGSDKTFLKTKIQDFARFSRQLQLTPSQTGMGEPKFEINGQPYNGDWCRPQYDGPALRAIALSQFAQRMLNEGQESYVRSQLYDGRIPAQSVIKADLEFVSHHWRDSNCDLWEEVLGDHFYTRMAQRRALLEGAALAVRLGDVTAADWYRRQALQIESELAKHWNGHFITSTLNGTGDTHNGKGGLDASVVLAALHSEAGPFMNPLDARIIATANKAIEYFYGAFPINQRPNLPGVAIGRYPGDRYGGTHFNGGNPWVLITAAFARLHYRVAEHERANGNEERARAWLARGDDFLRRVRVHANADGSLSEQIDRNSGFMVSARDLTWNYSEVLEAIWTRNRLVRQGD